MFRRILPLFKRHSPIAIRMALFSFTFCMMKQHSQLFSPIKCFHMPSFSSNNNMIAQILPKIIRIEQNGEIIGYAFSFSQRLIVTTSHQVLDKRNKNHKFQFYLGDQRIDANFKIIGKFEHLTFLQSDKNVLPVLPAKDPQLYTQVQIIQNRSYLSIKNGYYVANDSGFGIINGKGQVGSLILNQDGIVGIVTQIGRDADYGFLRSILWKDIKNVAKRLQHKGQSNIYLGMSVVSSDERQGIAVVRVAPNSPLSNYIKMGDFVTKVNNNVIKNPDDLVRVIMSSDNKVVFEIQDQQRNRKLITVQI